MRASLLGSLLLVSACVSELASIDEPEGVPDAGVERAPSSDDDEPTTELAHATADAFACFRPEAPSTLNGGYTCEGSPNLSLSTLCREGASYHVVVDASAADMTMGVIAPHGGKIEPATDDIALGLARDLDLPHYVFVAHAADACLDKYGGPARSNHRALHITSTHFNDARAEVLMRSVDRGVSIHGHGGPNKLCVGGRTPALRTAFRRYYETYARPYSPTRAKAVDATLDDDCAHIAGTSPHNISNRSKSGAGLQLELSRTVRAELVASMRGDRRLWTRFRNAVRAACRVSLNGRSGCW